MVPDEHSTPDQIAAGLRARLHAALTGFEKLSQLDPDLNYVPPPAYGPAGSVTGLVNLLVARGVFTEAEFVTQALIAQCEIVETQLTAAAEHMRQRTGIIAPLGRSTRPQG